MRTSLGQIGNLLPRWFRRLILDRLGGARVAAALAKDRFIQVAPTDSLVIFANPIYHGGMVKRGRVVYEEGVVSLIESKLQGGMTFYDVGANIGVFTFLAALRTGRTGKVISFEPEPNNIVCLEKSIELNASIGP